MPELSLAKRPEAVAREARKDQDRVIEILRFVTLETESQQLIKNARRRGQRREIRVLWR